MKTWLRAWKTPGWKAEILRTLISPDPQLWVLQTLWLALGLQNLCLHPLPVSVLKYVLQSCWANPIYRWRNDLCWGHLFITIEWHMMGKLSFFCCLFFLRMIHFSWISYPLPICATRESTHISCIFPAHCKLLMKTLPAILQFPLFIQATWVAVAFFFLSLYIILDKLSDQFCGLVFPVYSVALGYCNC